MSDTPKWQGYLVTGTVDKQRLIADLDACFAGGEINGIVIEPARIFSATGSTRKKVQVWNANRTHVTRDVSCVQPEYQNTDAWVLQWQGDPDVFRIAGGYQADVRHSSETTVVISSTVGGGEFGAPTEEIPLFADEQVVSGSYLDGGASCDEVLRSINGVGGPVLRIYSTLGALIGNHPELNRVVINVGGEGINFCPDIVDPEQVECLPPLDGSCGPISGTVVCPGEPDVKAGFKDTFSSSTGSPGGFRPATPTTVQSSLSNSQLYGNCQYRRDESGWVLVVDGAHKNAQCNPPGSQGYLGQVRTVLASAIELEVPWMIRNPYFNEGDKYWVMPSGIIIDADHSTLFERLPYAQFTGKLSQPLLPLPNGRYRVQFQYECDAELKYSIYSPRLGAAVYQSSVFPDTDPNVLGDYFDLTADAITVEFETTGVARVTEVGIIPWRLT